MRARLLSWANLQPAASLPVILKTFVRGALPWLVPALLTAQQPVSGAIIGRVTARADSAAAESPAARATVTLEPGGRRAFTDAAGRYAFAGVAPGAFTLRVRLFGFESAERAVRVAAGDTIRMDVVLRAAAQQLAPVSADARSDEQRTFETRPNIATVGLTAAAMAGVPKLGEPDVIRVVQLLPGVVSRNDFNTGLNVRGGEADQNLVLLDGFPIYNPFHLGGLFSTFMDATVGGIELLSGAFPARFGGRLSSVLDVRSAQESERGINAIADISALGTSVKLGGVVDGGRASWSVAGRRTYADAAADLFTDNVFPYHFRDLHARVAWAPGATVRIGLTAYSGRDVLDLNLAEVESDSTPTEARDGAWSFDWGNQVAGVSISKDFGPRGIAGLPLPGGATLEQRVSTSSFGTTLNVGSGAFEQSSALRDVRLTGSLTTRAATHESILGYELATYRIRYASGAAQLGTNDFELEQSPSTAAAWLDDLWRVSPRWIVQSGVRAEALPGRSWVGLSPRLSVKFFARPDLALTAGAGRATQMTHSMAGDGPLRYFDIWLASDEYTPVTTAWHWVAGAERRLRERGSIRVEGFVKRYDRVVEPNPAEDPRRRGDEFDLARGTSYGVDMLARWQPTSALGGWLAYTYGVSWRERGGARWAPGHDRRHDVDLVATWHGRSYRLGARVGYATGSPYTPIVGQIVRRIYDPSQDRWGTGDPRIFIESLGAGRNSARFPATHRVDLDAAREFTVRGVTVAPYVSVVNVYNARNVFVYLYDYSTDRPTRRAISQFPILPSAGVRIAF